MIVRDVTFNESKASPSDFINEKSSADVSFGINGLYFLKMASAFLL